SPYVSPAPTLPGVFLHDPSGVQSSGTHTVTVADAFALNGTSPNERLTAPRSVGDVNGDGYEDFYVGNVRSGPVSVATNTGPVVITSDNHGLQSGAKVFIYGAGPGANGTWTITKLDDNRFSLNNSSSSTTYVNGTWFSGTGYLLFGPVNLHSASA